MNTRIIKISEENKNLQDMKEAAEIIRDGGLVAFPTETVYGLGGNALRKDASQKIYAAKGRPSDNPLIVHIADMEILEQLTVNIPEKGRQLAEQFWPGPLTLIFRKSDAVPYETTGGLDTVAVRMPSHPVALELIRQSGVCIAAPSANTSGRPSPTKACHVQEDLDGKIDMIIDGGMVGIGLESTIVDVTSEIPIILRPGYITQSMLEEVVGPVEIDQPVKGNDVEFVPKAPGMKYKHYAPKGDLIVFEGEPDEVVEEINRRTDRLIKEGYTVGIIATEETKANYGKGIVKIAGTREDEDSIARSLYAILREFDHVGAEYIFSESFSSGNLGHAIMNRLLKAAGYQVVEIKR